MKELYEKVAADPALQKQVEEILTGAEEKGAEATEAALLAFAKEQGFTVTMEEVKAFFEGMQTAGELSENELDQVAGGKCGKGIALLTFASIMSFGIVCAVISTGKDDAGLEHCSDAFNKNAV